VRAHEAKRHAAATGKHLGFEFDSFHRRSGSQRFKRITGILAHAMRLAYRVPV
jgi:hypothetical protein